MNVCLVFSPWRANQLTLAYDGCYLRSTQVQPNNSTRPVIDSISTASSGMVLWKAVRVSFRRRAVVFREVAEYFDPIES